MKKIVFAIFKVSAIFIVVLVIAFILFIATRKSWLVPADEIELDFPQPQSSIFDNSIPDKAYVTYIAALDATQTAIAVFKDSYSELIPILNEKQLEFFKEKGVEGWDEIISEEENKFAVSEEGMNSLNFPILHRKLQYLQEALSLAREAAKLNDPKKSLNRIYEVEPFQNGLRMHLLQELVNCWILHISTCKDTSTDDYWNEIMLAIKFCNLYRIDSPGTLWHITANGCIWNLLQDIRKMAEISESLNSLNIRKCNDNLYTHLNDRISLQNYLRMERLETQHLKNNIFKKIDEGVEEPFMIDLWTGTKMPLAVFKMLEISYLWGESRSQIGYNIDAYYKFLIKNSQQNDSTKSYAQYSSILPATSGLIDFLSYEKPHTRLILSYIVVPTESVFRNYANSINNFYATGIILAIHAFKNKYKKLPGDLQDLVPEYLSHIPSDAFSSHPFRYIIRNNTWYVYNYGPDGIDNHANFGSGLVGRCDKPGQDAVWPGNEYAVRKAAYSNP